MRYNDHSEKTPKGIFIKKNLFSSLLRRGRCPIALTIAVFPFTFPSTSAPGLNFLIRSISRCKNKIASEPTASSYRVALLLLLRPPDGVADNNHTNWKKKKMRRNDSKIFFSSMVFIIHKAEWMMFYVFWDKSHWRLYYVMSDFCNSTSVINWTTRLALVPTKRTAHFNWISMWFK